MKLKIGKLYVTKIGSAPNPVNGWSCRTLNNPSYSTFVPTEGAVLIYLGETVDTNYSSAYAHNHKVSMFLYKDQVTLWSGNSVSVGGLDDIFEEHK